jgi:dCMP deaminase
MLMLARWWSQWSTCPRLSAGCVITTPEYVPIASGYNGAPRGVPHCIDDGCHLIGGHCTAVHAEQNALMHAASLGIAVHGMAAFITHRPCIRCAYLLGQAGVCYVGYSEDYDSDNAKAEVLSYFNDRKITNFELRIALARRGEIIQWR